MNGEYLRRLSPDEFFTALRQTILSDDYIKAIAPLVQTRMETLGQFGDMTGFFFADNIMPTQELFVPKKRTLEDTLAFAADMLTALEACDWTTEAIDTAVRALLTEKEWSVKEGFMLLRAVLTGSTASPPLLESLVVFGKARSLDRFRRFMEAQKKAAALANRGK
jgi:glutamyl-tRNA synthetase